MSDSVNPTACVVLVDGKPCGKPTSWVMRSSFATRIICDECARNYAVSGIECPMAEISWAEIKPAREELLKKVEDLLVVVAEQEAMMARMRTLTKRKQDRDEYAYNFLFWGSAVAMAATAYATAEIGHWAGVLIGSAIFTASYTIPLFRWVKIPWPPRIPRRKTIVEDPIEEEE